MGTNRRFIVCAADLAPEVAAFYLVSDDAKNAIARVFRKKAPPRPTPDTPEGPAPEAT